MKIAAHNSLDLWFLKKRWIDAKTDLAQIYNIFHITSSI